MSDLKDKSALSVVGSFIITLSSYEYVFADKDQIRTNAIHKLVAGAILYEVGKFVNKYNKE